MNEFRNGMWVVGTDLTDNKEKVGIYFANEFHVVDDAGLTVARLTIADLISEEGIVLIKAQSKLLRQARYDEIPEARRATGISKERCNELGYV